MNKFWASVKDETKHLTQLANQESPLLFMVGGVLMLGSAAAIAWKNSPKAHKKVEDLREQRELTPIDQSKITEIVEEVVTVAPDILPVIVLVIMGAICCTKSYKISAKRIATLGALLGLSQDKIKLLEDKLVEELGLEKAADIRKEVDEELENREEDPERSRGLSGRFNGVEYLIKDKVSGQYFITSAAAIKNAEAEINSLLDPINGGEDFVDLNYLYELLKIEPLGEGLGDLHGWSRECPCSLYLNCDHGEVRKDKIPFNVLEFDYTDRPDPRCLH